ncbi:NAD(P)-dependent alcohol dehydrogenase [Agromyces mediolanus]|uniref:NADPH:quinone reductase n=1 Tax=Agromyces mediolanus TaxID=41986 RepID=A0A918FH38_AGRME|nr:NAD(P)-dependent alcohol dehydrogenase [Agromyces mediolanus]GGR37131.1 NADPH:quinone reductase [Agromyces mediolanus]GLJ73970.1 NADPH:quinone reductase [Agromyces mediolanus]
MRAVVVERYGPPEVARLVERPDPVPGPGQVLVRVEASTVNSGDARIRAGRFPDGFGAVARLAFGFRGPRRPVLGNVVSGVVVAVGPEPRGRAAARLAGAPGARLAIGDRVCGMTGVAMGAHAELVAIARGKLAPIPADVSFDDAAGVLFGGSTALHYLTDKGGVRAGHRVLVIGASGAVGTSAVQLAKHFGAQVTAVSSARNAALATELGADRVLDYRETPPEELDDRFDLVLDTVGALSPATGRPLLADGGRLLLVVASLGETITARGPVKTGPAPERAESFASLLELVAAGRLRVVHEAALPLDRIAEAYALVDSGRKVGNLVVHPQPASTRRRPAQQRPERTPS